MKNDNPGQANDLLRAGADPNGVDESGEPALVSALRYRAPRVVDLLMRQPGIDLDRASERGETPLMLAAHTGRRDVVARLLDQGVPVNRAGWSALHYAASEGHLEIVRFLLDRRAVVDAESPGKVTPLMMAARGGRGEVCKMLIEAGANAARKNDAGLTAADFAERANEADLAEQLRRIAQARNARP